MISDLSGPIDILMLIRAAITNTKKHFSTVKISQRSCFGVILLIVLINSLLKSIHFEALFVVVFAYDIFIMVVQLSTDFQILPDRF